MKLFKNLFSVAALVAVIGFSSFSTNARPVNSSYYSVYDYEDYLLANADDVDEPFVFDQDYFSLFTMLMNLSTPYSAGDGIEISSVTFDDNDLTFNITCNEYMAFGLHFIRGEKAEEVKEILAEGMYNMFIACGEDDEEDTIVDKMKLYGINTYYKFYTEGKDSPVMTMTITPEYIESVGKKTNIAFYK